MSTSISIVDSRIFIFKLFKVSTYISESEVYCTVVVHSLTQSRWICISPRSRAVYEVVSLFYEGFWWASIYKKTWKNVHLLSPYTVYSIVPLFLLRIPHSPSPIPPPRPHESIVGEGIKAAERERSHTSYDTLEPTAHTQSPLTQGRFLYLHNQRRYSHLTKRSYLKGECSEKRCL